MGVEQRQGGGWLRLVGCNFYAVHPSAQCDGKLMVVSRFTVIIHNCSSQLRLLGNLSYRAVCRPTVGSIPETSQNSLESKARPSCSIGRGKARMSRSPISCFTQSRGSSVMSHSPFCPGGAHEKTSSHQSYTLKSVRHHRCPANLLKLR